MKEGVKTRDSLSKKPKVQRRELPGTLETNFITSSFPLKLHGILILAYKPDSSEMCYLFLCDWLQLRGLLQPCQPSAPSPHPHQCRQSPGSAASPLAFHILTPQTSVASRPSVYHATPTPQLGSSPPSDQKPASLLLLTRLSTIAQLPFAL